MGSSNESNKHYKYVIWIDKNVNNLENSGYANELSKSYSKISTFLNIDDALEFLKKIKFSLTYLIVSGSLFSEFLSKFKKMESKISTVPKIIIFTSEITKSKIYKMKEINNSFYDLGGLAINFDDIKLFLQNNNFFKDYEFFDNKKRERVYNDANFIFQKIETINDLVGPVFLCDIIIRPDKSEYKIFDKYLIDNYGEEMENLISQIYNITDCPDSLRIKYWLRAYTLETKFYKDMNLDLEHNNIKKYLTYIKFLYFGLADNFIDSYKYSDLYRGALMNKEEIDNLISHLSIKKSGIPSGLIYCKSFMSFSLDKNVALSFMNNKIPNKSEVRILFILSGEKNLDSKNLTNADLTNISYFENEKEILLFPFSIYEVNNIKKINDYYEIYLNYLGKYKKIFNFANQTELYNTIFKSKFIQEIENIGLSLPIWLAKKSLCKIRYRNMMASGFCCLIPIFNKNKVPVLIACEHLINLDNIRKGCNINLDFNDFHELISIRIDERTKIYSDKKFDITIIEIKETDELKDKLLFMEIDEDVFNENLIQKNFGLLNAYILHYCFDISYREKNINNFVDFKKNNNLKLKEITNNKGYYIEEGEIQIIENKIIHNMSTGLGSSGAPIISSNKFKVIGYHTGSFMKGHGFGWLLQIPIQNYIKQFYQSNNK